MKTLDFGEPGSVIDVLAPSGKVVDPTTFQHCEMIINEWGYQVSWSKNIIGNHAFLSNTITNRFEDLKKALYSPSKMIWPYRGGSGSAELLPLLSTLPAPKTQKIFLGFSDLTSLHLFFNQQWNWITFHGPVVKQLLNESLDVHSLILLKHFLQHGFDLKNYNVYHELQLNDYNSAAKNNHFNIQAPMTGGNLTVICHTLGTSNQIISDHKILLLEDVNEPAYKIRRMLTHLSQAGIFSKVKAVILGNFIEYNRSEPMKNYDTEKELFEFSESQSFPVFKTDKIGHGKQNYVVPFNSTVQLIKT